MQEIILFLYRATKCPTEVEKIEYPKNEITNDFRGQTKPNKQNFLSCTTWVDV